MGRLLVNLLAKGPRLVRGGGVVGIILTGMLSAIGYHLGSDLYQRAKKARQDAEGPKEG